MTAWARLLAGPARHGWVSRDVNQLIRDWIGVRGWVPYCPHKPIGLLGAMLAWHGDLAKPPAAADMAREAAELAAHRAQLAAQLAGRTEAARARALGRAALDSPGHAAARAPSRPRPPTWRCAAGPPPRPRRPPVSTRRSTPPADSTRQPDDSR